MNQLSDFKNSKQSIMDAMYRELENTVPGNWYFDEKNIRDCANHLVVGNADEAQPDKESRNEYNK